jgi:hypothetical protein
MRLVKRMGDGQSHLIGAAMRRCRSFHTLRNRLDQDSRLAGRQLTLLDQAIDDGLIGLRSRGEHETESAAC